MAHYIDLARCTPEVQIAARCIGLNFKKPYERYGKTYFRPFQNRFLTAKDATEYGYWVGLEARGFARRQRQSGESICFYLTAEGMTWLGRLLGITIVRRMGQ